MADEDVNNAPIEGAEEEAAPVAVPEGPMDPMTALQEVLKTALKSDGLARGLRQAVRALDRKEAVLCVLADNCDIPAYVNLVTALCYEHSIPLLKVDDNRQLGIWAGLCKLDDEGEAHKVVRTSCVVVRHYGEDTEARARLLEHLKSQSSE